MKSTQIIFFKKSVHAVANKLAKKYKLPFIFRMCHGRHLNLKERLIADCTSKVYKQVLYMPTLLEKSKFILNKDYKKCSCKGTKCNGKCMFPVGTCRKEASVYKVTVAPSNHTYIGKAQGGLGKRINLGHINGLKPFCNLRDRFEKRIAKIATTIKKLTMTPRRNKPSKTKPVATPESSQELSQTPDQSGMLALIKLMSENLTPVQKPNSSDESDLETESEMSTEDEISQPLTPEDPFQREFGMRLTEMDF